MPYPCGLQQRRRTLPTQARGRRGVFAIISRRRAHWRSLDWTIKTNYLLFDVDGFSQSFSKHSKHTAMYGTNFHFFSHSQSVFPRWRWAQKPWRCLFRRSRCGHERKTADLRNQPLILQLNTLFTFIMSGRKPAHQKSIPFTARTLANGTTCTNGTHG